MRDCGLWERRRLDASVRGKETACGGAGPIARCRGDPFGLAPGRDQRDGAVRRRERLCRHARSVKAGRLVGDRSCLRRLVESAGAGQNPFTQARGRSRGASLWLALYEQGAGAMSRVSESRWGIRRCARMTSAGGYEGRRIAGPRGAPWSGACTVMIRPAARWGMPHGVGRIL